MRLKQKSDGQGEGDRLLISFLKTYTLKLPLSFLSVLLFIAVVLSGCSAFDSTYIVESDYALPEGKESPRDDVITVNEFSELREAIRSTVSDGSNTIIIIFDPGYIGTPSEDLASACWQIRTEDALCAYCVENIAYDLNQYVNRSEARLNIRYSEKAIPVSDIITMPYATELDDTLKQAIGNGTERLAILISRSTLSSDAMLARIEAVYRENPMLAPQEPECTVTVFSGTGTQSLYELTLANSLTPEEFYAKKTELSEVSIPDTENMDDLARIHAITDFLTPRCDENAPGTIYAALVSGSAGPEGIALGCVALCQQLNIECVVVYGQKDWQDHCWNIVRINDRYYHIDLFSDTETEILKSDEEMWDKYRWNVNDYPKCELPFSVNTNEEDTEHSIAEESIVSEDSDLKRAESVNKSNESSKQDKEEENQNT